MILETERLYLREMKQSDFDSLCKILQDEDTMYAYEGAFSDNEVNIASQNVAIRNGMTRTDTWTKHYRGVDMPHYRYVVEK